MKCTKCKNVEIVVDDEIIRMNQSGKIIYDHIIGHCPCCGIKYDFDKHGMNGNSKSSDMSICAAIMAATIIGCPVAVVLAIVDIVKGKKEEEHYLSAIAIVIAIIEFWVFFNLYMGW